MFRTIERRNARRLYDSFSRAWRREKRMAGLYGKPGRKPPFNQWYHMHERDASLMRQSTPSDVREYLGLDPWAPPPVQAAPSVPDERPRGVVTYSMSGDPEDSK